MSKEGYEQLGSPDPQRGLRDNPALMTSYDEESFGNLLETTPDATRVGIGKPFAYVNEGTPLLRGNFDDGAANVSYSAPVSSPLSRFFSAEKQEADEQEAALGQNASTGSLNSDMRGSPRLAHRLKIPFSPRPTKKWTTQRTSSLVGSLIVFFLLLLVAAPPTYPSNREVVDALSTVNLLESMPVGLDLAYVATSMPTWQGYVQLVDSARDTLDISCYYMTLSQGPLGIEVFDAVVRAIRRGVHVRIAENIPNEDQPANDTLVLRALGAELRDIPFLNLTTGILHTKFIISDSQNLYLGSSNMDWRSLLHVKELGLLFWDAPALAADLTKVFNTYWNLPANPDAIDSRTGRIYVPAEWSTAYNYRAPMRSRVNGTEGDVFISESPPSITPRGRTDDLESILTLINTANDSVCVSVMDYIPLGMYAKPYGYWPDIQDALIQAAYRKVHVRVMASKWDHTHHVMFEYLEALAAINHIEVRLFIVPNDGYDIPYTRVNHAKFLIADDTIFVGTSNWVRGYFTSTAGCSIISTHGNIVVGVKDVFERDWGSQYVTANLTQFWSQRWCH